MESKLLPTSRSTPRSNRVSGLAPQGKVLTPARLATYSGEAECPQCGQLGEAHTKDCPHNLRPRDGIGLAGLGWVGRRRNKT